MKCPDYYNEEEKRELNKIISLYEERGLITFSEMLSLLNDLENEVAIRIYDIKWRSKTK